VFQQAQRQPPATRPAVLEHDVICYTPCVRSEVSSALNTEAVDSSGTSYLSTRPGFLNFFLIKIPPLKRLSVFEVLKTPNIFRQQFVLPLQPQFVVWKKLPIGSKLAVVLMIAQKG
jgi:hypothetical protein